MSLSKSFLYILIECVQIIFLLFFFFIQIQLDYFSAYHDQSIPTNKISLLSCYLLVDLLNKVWWGRGTPPPRFVFTRIPRSVLPSTSVAPRSCCLSSLLGTGQREVSRKHSEGWHFTIIRTNPLTGKQSNPVYPVNVSRIPDCILVKSRILGIPFLNRYENYPLRQALSNFEREIYRLDLGVSLY